MPHIPKFPPELNDWLPGNPLRGELPLPGFLRNPLAIPETITPEEYNEVVGKYGLWATRRAIAFLPRTATRTELEKVAKALYVSAMPGA